MSWRERGILEYVGTRHIAKQRRRLRKLYRKVGRRLKGWKLWMRRKRNGMEEDQF